MFDVLQPTSPAPDAPAQQPFDNVVVLILESFHRDMIREHPQYGVPAPFLKSLTQKSLFFDNGFANSTVSMDAVPSTMIDYLRL